MALAKSRDKQQDTDRKVIQGTNIRSENMRGKNGEQRETNQYDSKNPPAETRTYFCADTESDAK